MAVLEKLNVCGIRSFGPAEPESIKFSTPLTLLLGQNGSGKTTIIESIKFALTGELPVGAKTGGGFVNDPKLSNKSSTKASVKIRFRGVKGDIITVGRFLEVSKKAGGGLTCKGIMPSIRWQNSEGDDKQDISGRCVNIDSYCSEKLNVSRPILNNVIFCHQENSAWPLDEAKKLKDKFDEIFGATEYNKCVDKLRKLHKEKMDQIKILKIEFEGTKKCKQEVELQKDRLSARKEKLNLIIEKTDQKQNEIKPMQKRMDEILDLEQVLGSLQIELKGKEKSLEGVVDQQNTIKKSISYIFKGTDQELNDKISSFAHEQKTAEKSIKDMEQKKKEVENRIVETNRDMQKIQVRIGQLKEEENQYKKKCEESKELIQVATVRLNVLDIDQTDDSNQILNKLNKAIEIFGKNFEKLVEEKDAEEIALQNIIDEVREKYASSKESLSSKERLYKELQQKIQELRLKLRHLDTSDTQLKIVEERIKTLQANLTERIEAFDEIKKSEEIDELKEEIQRKEKYSEKLEKEYRVLQQNYVAEQTIDKEKISIIEKQGEIYQIKGKQAQNFELIFEGNVPENNYETSVKQVHDREEIKFQNLTKTADQLQRKVTTLEATIKHTERQLEKHREELNLNQNKVASLCKGKQFTEVLKDCYIRKEKLQRDKGTYRSAKVMYEAFINEFEKEASPCCPVCQTDFTSKKSAVNQIVLQLKKKIEELPKKLDTVERDLKKEEELYNKLQQLKPVSDHIEILTEAQIPTLEADLQESQETLENTSMELCATRNDLVAPENLVKTCRRVITDAALLDRHLLELEKSNTVITELEKKLVKVPSKRTRDEVDSELDNVKAELSTLRKQQETKKQVFDQFKERTQNTNANIQNEIHKKLEMQKRMQEKPLLQTQLKDSSVKLTEVNNDKVHLVEKISVLEEQLKKANSDRQNAVSKNKAIKEEQRRQLNSHKDIVNDIQKIQNSINQYLSKNNQEKLESEMEKLSSTKSNLEKLETAKNNLFKKISDMKENLASQESGFRALTDNKTLREIQEKQIQLEKQISDLKIQKGNHNYRSVYETKQEIQKKIISHNREIDTMIGEQKEIEKYIKELEADLNKPANKNAEKNYLKKFHELRVQELVTDDLDLYCRALEKSVLQFHKDRMVQINKTIRELWRSIYKGNDIDYIEIQTDITIGNTKKRSYNYKVVQIKKGVELEMRGRCSAGQRVLACLVIRMALAETFSANCGILALDEPTTNLDKENIDSLSDALSKIITAREGQRNFQLVVITHDADFLRTLTREQSVSHFWRVKRNAEGFSEIKKEIL